ncbi:MAG TPA: hypothetical protein VGC62_27500 [Pseudomonas sp.]|uniref:hypothetical protein n=1 Tax=Pseudomonas sp. TaxID=306 RepID=UPI002ED8A0ED
MSNKAKTETELQAWDQYLAAAIELGRTGVSGANTSDFLDKVVKQSAEIADRMLAERRKRS